MVPPVRKLAWMLSAQIACVPHAEIGPAGGGCGQGGTAGSDAPASGRRIRGLGLHRIVDLRLSISAQSPCFCSSLPIGRERSSVASISTSFGSRSSGRLPSPRPGSRASCEAAADMLAFLSWLGGALRPAAATGSIMRFENLRIAPENVEGLIEQLALVAPAHQHRDAASSTRSSRLPDAGNAPTASHRIHRLARDPSS